MNLLYPDKVVDFILEEVTYQSFSGINFVDLWELLRVKLNIDVDDLYQRIVYSWLKNNENLEIGTITKTKENNGSNSIRKEAFSVKDWPENYPNPEKYGIRAHESYQWIILTGAPKQNNPIGVSAFQLIVEIARHREEGIDSLQLVKATCQDARSLTSRIKAIGHLIKKIQILKNGRTLSLFILLKFFDPAKLQSISINNKEREVTINLKDLREKIVNTLKAAKSGIRQLNDLRRELELDRTNRYKRVFKSNIAYLEAKGYISKVLVVSPVSPTKKFRSVKYIKDFKQDTDEVDDAEDELEFNDELIDDELKDIDDEEPSTSLKSVVNLQVVEPSESNIHVPLYNRFFPFQNQIYQVVEKHGISGCSSNYLIEEVFGFEYTRLFSKLIESYTTDPKNPGPKFIEDYELIRHYDFQGRVKFYRYVTQPNWAKLSNKPKSATGAVLPPYKAKKLIPTKSFEKKYFSALSSKVDLYVHNGEKKIAWYGSGSKLAPEVKQKLKEQQAATEKAIGIKTTAKRGRPKKGEVREKKDTKKRKLKEINDDVVMIDANESPKKVDDKKVKIKRAEEEKAKEETKELEIDGIKGLSFKAIERRSAILRILNDSDGVRLNDHDFVNELRNELGYNIDKKTFKNDLEGLITQNKLVKFSYTAEVEHKQTYEILKTKDAEEDALLQFEKSLNSRKTEKGPLRILDEVSLDIDFFDTELRESFHNLPAPTPSVELTTRVPRIARVKKERVKKIPKKESKVKEPKNQSDYTARVEAKEWLDENTTPDDIFANFKSKLKTSRKFKGQVKVPEDATVNNNAIKTRKPQGSRKKRNISQLNSEDTILLFKAVVICKTINANQINWKKIAKLLNIDTDILRMKWPRIRMMMGQTGVKLARRNWKRILLSAIKEEKITMDGVENLNLEELIKIWTDSDSLTGMEETSEKLYSNIEENYKRYKFVKVGETESINQYDSNSMVQREQFLVNKVFTYDESDIVEKEQNVVTKQEIIKKIIIAIVSSGNNLDIKKLSVLDQFTEDEINEVFIQMTKDRDIVISGIDNTIYLGDKITALLDDHTFDFELYKATKFQHMLKELLTSNKAIILDQVFDNSIMVPILELLKDQALNLTRVDHYRKELLTGYEARTLEREKLNSSIILTAGNNDLIQLPPEKQVLVPQGKPCSHLWIDIKGGINKSIWHKVLRVIVTILLSQPGITEPGIRAITKPLLSNEDLSLVLKWLQDSRVIKSIQFDGYWLESQWYVNLGI